MWTTDDGRRTDGRTTEHGYTISSPCEPDGSGELIIPVNEILVPNKWLNEVGEITGEEWKKIN